MGTPGQEERLGARVGDTLPQYLARDSVTLPPAVEAVLARGDAATVDELTAAAGMVLEETPILFEEAQTRSSNFYEHLVAFQASTNALARLAAQVAPDSDLAAGLGAIGNTTSLVLQGMDLLARSQAATGLAAGLFTTAGIATFATAVLSVTQLFGSRRPSPESILAQQIGRLTQEIQLLRQEEWERFHLLSAQIEKVMETVERGFVDIQLALALNHDFDQGIARDLQTLRTELNARFRSLFMALDASFEREWESKVSELLAQPDLTTESLRDGLRYALLVALDFSRDALATNAGATPPLSQLAATLGSRDAYHNMELLAQVLDREFGVKLGAKLPNPTYWNASAELVLELIARGDQAELEAAGVSKALDDLINEGETNIRGPMQRMVLGDGASGSPLVLLATYLGLRLDELTKASREAQTRLHAQLLPQTGALDLFGPATQPPVGVEGVTVTNCDGGGGSWQLPADQVTSIVPPAVSNADRLEVGSLQVCAKHDGYVDRGWPCVATCNINYITQCCRWQHRGLPIVELRVKSGDVLMTRERVVGPEMDNTGAASSAVIQQAWSGILAAIGRGEVESSPETTNLDTLETAVTAELLRLRVLWLDALANEALNGSALANLADECQGLHTALSEILTLTGRTADGIVAAMEAPGALKPERAWLAAHYRGFAGPGSPSEGLATLTSAWSDQLTDAMTQHVARFQEDGASLMLPPDLTLSRLRHARGNLPPFVAPVGTAQGWLPPTYPRVYGNVLTASEINYVTNPADAPTLPKGFVALQMARVSTTAAYEEEASEVCFIVPEGQTRPVSLAVADDTGTWRVAAPSEADTAKGIACVSAPLPALVALVEETETEPGDPGAGGAPGETPEDPPGDPSEAGTGHEGGAMSRDPSIGGSPPTGGSPSTGGRKPVVEPPAGEPGNGDANESGADQLTSPRAPRRFDGCGCRLGDPASPRSAWLALAAARP
ncbi:MAG TPA: hypothetical protein VJN18_11435 [Polyangiaceae bacterium]|nr:hypothetical protein [Polyangiaceae bacterium]